ncbi:MAG: glycosyltransferase family 2 protein, partial [Prevotella sp.]
MKVAVIILNYNSSTDCRKCISDLKRQEGVALEIIIVDNCSREDDALAVKSLAKEQGCTFIAAKENRGYNAGNNIGLRHAAEQGYEYALIANPDMEFPERDYIMRLVNVMERKTEVAVCGSNIVTTEGHRQNPKKYTTYSEELLWPINGLFNLLFHKSFILDVANQYCEMLMGSCILVRMSFIEKIGYFDENVFLYCEEPILGKQVKKANMKMFYLDDVTAVHAHVASEKGSFVRRHDIYWKSRWYYLKNYSGYNQYQLSMMFLSKSIHYGFKRL